MPKTMKNLVEEFNECCMNTCATEEKLFYTTEEIKNNDMLCKEWVQKWKYDIDEDEIKSLRKELFEAQRKHTELKEVIKTILKYFH